MTDLAVLQQFINHLAECPQAELGPALRANMAWTKPRGDLHHWQPVLDRFDGIFGSMVSTYGLDAATVPLRIMAPADQDLAVACLNFTYLLLEHCGGRSGYGGEKVYQLVATPTVAVRTAALEVAVCLGERYVHKGMKVGREVRARMVGVVHGFPRVVPLGWRRDQALPGHKPIKTGPSHTSSGPTGPNQSSSHGPSQSSSHGPSHTDRSSERSERPVVIGDHYAYAETLNPHARYPDQWKQISFPYYKKGLKSPKKSKTAQAGAGENTGTDRASASAASSLSTFTISPAHVRKLSLDQIFDKASDVLPPELWFEFALHAETAKAFAANDAASMDLRAHLLRCKLSAISFLICSSSEEFISSRVFEQELYILNFVIDMITPGSMDSLDGEVYFLAVKTLECISLKRSWGGELVRCLGGNVNHGVLYQSLRHIRAKLRRQDEDCNHRAYIHFFNMLGNLIDTKSLTPRLGAGGVLKELMEFLVDSFLHRWEASAAVHLISVFLSNSGESINDFVGNNGFQLLIETIGYEVNFAVENPGFDGGAPKDAVVYYTISFRQANYLRNLMKLVTHLIQWDSGDRLRNLFDSPLLAHFNTVLLHPTTFGPMILASTIDSVFYIIHNEPTAYGILNEANVIGTILDNFASFLLPNGDLLLSLPEVLGAIALNKEGLQRVEEKKCFETFFTVFQDAKYCKDLAKNDLCRNLGASFDELGRHYPSFKPIIVGEIQKFLGGVLRLNEELGRVGIRYFVDETEGSSKDKGQLEQSQGQASSQLVPWEKTPPSYILESFVGFVQTLLPEGDRGAEFLNAITFEKWLNLLVLPNAPYDFATSNYIFNYLDVVSCFDDNDLDSCFPYLCKLCMELMGPIAEFLAYQGPSYFEYIGANRTPDQCTEFFRALNAVVILLSALSSGFFRYGMIAHSRYFQLGEIFGSEAGLKFLESLGTLLSKVIIEENYIRTNGPRDVIKDTTPFPEGGTENPKLRIVLEPPPEKKPPPKTSHVYKNVIQIRHMCFHLQHLCGDIFGYIGRIGTHRRQEYVHTEPRRRAVKISTHLGVVFGQMVAVDVGDAYLQRCYELLVCRVVWYVVSQKDRGKDVVQTMLVMGMLQAGVFERIRDMGVRVFGASFAGASTTTGPNSNTSSSTGPTGASTDGSKDGYTLADPLSINQALLSTVITILVGINTAGSFLDLPNAGQFFHSDDSFNEVSATTSYSKKIGIEFLRETVGKVYGSSAAGATTSGASSGSSDGASSTTSGAGSGSSGGAGGASTTVISNLISLAEHVQSHTDSKFYPLNWKNVTPPYDQIEYLKSIGLAEAKAVHYFKHASTLDPLAAGDWPCPSSTMDLSEMEQLQARIQADNKTFPAVELVDFGPQISAYPPPGHHQVWFNVAQAYPEVVEDVARLVSPNAAAWVHLGTVLSRIVAGEMDATATTAWLQGHMELIRAMLDTKVRIKLSKNEYLQFYKDIAVIMVELMAQNLAVVNTSYGAAGLAVVEQALWFQDVPEPELCVHSSVQSMVVPELVVRDLVTSDTETKLFEMLLSLNHLENKPAVVAVVRAMLVLTKDHARRETFAGSALVGLLVRSSTMFFDSDGTKDQQLLAVLLRRCYETPAVVRAHMAVEVLAMLEKPRRELPGFLKEALVLAVRDGKEFVDVVGERMVLEGYDGSRMVMAIGPAAPALGQGQQTSETATETGATASTASTNSSTTGATGGATANASGTSALGTGTGTSAVSTIISQLLTATKKDLYSTPSSYHPTKKEKMEELFANRDFGHVCYLLQTLTELLGSYMASKMEFVTFRKGKITAKPRATALNVLIHQMVLGLGLALDLLAPGHGIEYERRQAVLSLAKLAILALMSSPIGPGPGPSPGPGTGTGPGTANTGTTTGATVPSTGATGTAGDSTGPNGPGGAGADAEDEEMAFIRKLASETMVRAISPGGSSPGSGSSAGPGPGGPGGGRYAKLIDLFDLITSILSSKFRHVAGPLFNKTTTKLDPFYIAKSLIDAQAPAAITTVIASLDLNFPGIDRVVKASVLPLTMLGKLKAEFQDRFEESFEKGDRDEEIPELDGDDDDATPDLFRNLTLGMYEPEDEDSYEDEFDQDEFDQYSLDGESDGSDEEDDGGISDESSDGMDVEDGDVSMADSFHFHDYQDEEEDEDESQDDSGSDVEIIDTTGPYSQYDVEYDGEGPYDEDEGSYEGSYEGYEGYDEGADEGSEEGDGYDEYEDESEYDEAVLDEWIEELDDGLEAASEAGELGRDLGRAGPRAGTNLSDLARDPELVEDDEFSDESGESQGDGGAEGGPEEFTSFFDALRPAGRGSIANIFGDMLGPDGVFSGTIHIGRTGEDGARIARTGFDGARAGRGGRLDRALEGILDLARPDGPKDPLSHLYIKSTVERWADGLLGFQAEFKEKLAANLIPAVVNRISARSIAVEEERQARVRESLKEREERRRQREAEAEARAEAEAQERAQAEAARREEANEDESTSSAVPVMVRIGDRDVDISGTDIDPEFFEALPDDMREEVFTQHIRERRAHGGASETREIDPDFLDALPDPIRREILQDEWTGWGSDSGDEDSEAGDGAGAGAIGSIFGAIGARAGAATGGASATGATTSATGGSGAGTGGATTGGASGGRRFFTPLIDRPGVAAIVRLTFVPQPMAKRDALHQALKYLCYNKQTRVEVVNLVLTILQGVSNPKGLERTFHQLSTRPKAKSRAVLPLNATPIVVANQAIDLLHFLIENNGHIRYYLLTEHENPYTRKKNKVERFQINGLLRLLESEVLREDQPFMDLLARVVQLSTRPLLSHGASRGEGQGPGPSSSEGQDTQDTSESQASQASQSQTGTSQSQETGASQSQGKESQTVHGQGHGPKLCPIVPDHLLRQMVRFLTANECANATFRRAIGAMQNLNHLPNGQRVFSTELGDQAGVLGLEIIGELREMIAQTSSTAAGRDADASSSTAATGSSAGATGANSSAASSSARGSTTTPASRRGSATTPASGGASTKLLRVLTALDYLFDISPQDDVEHLTHLYKNLALGSLWDALSDALGVLPEPTTLLPLIESLMVVCKHSQVKELSTTKYESRKVDFSKEPIESLFFSFTDEHKKILNQMVRGNPNLMSGPFGMLVRNPRVLEFDNKKNYFDRRLHDGAKDQKTLGISVRRDQVFLDSYRALFFKSRDEFRTSKLDVNFKGEAGIDAGGVTREWYQALSRQMFNPDYALFTPVASDENTYHPNRISYINPEHLSFFKFIGKIIGKAIYDGCFLDCHFSRAVYKRILGRSVSLKDMETLDLEYFKSLMWMLENDITNVIIEDFSVETDDYGEKKTVDLIPDGRNIPVTQENKHEYVRLVIEYRLQTSVAEQMDYFLMGFHEIIPKDIVSIFDEQELELLISGLPDIDVTDWQQNCSYNNYSASSEQIQWFWRAVKSFDNEERAKLLQFATGTSKVPLNGFKELSGANGTCKFSIHRDYGSLDRLPSSHTCFNQVDLPAYESYETLRGLLLLAITEGHQGFGLA